MNALTILIIYFICINLIGFTMMGIDKWKAKKGFWRIPESTLFIMAIIGGSIGSIIGMYLFRHKTRHFYFVLGMPAILFLQLLLIYILSKLPITFIFI